MFSRTWSGSAPRLPFTLLLLVQTSIAFAFPALDARAAPAAVPSWPGARTALEPGRSLAAGGTTLTCFEGSLGEAVSPACFTVTSPPPGWQSCLSDSGHFVAQFFDPGFPSLHRVTSLAFISNDSATVFPSAGVVLIPASENRYPTPGELHRLQVFNVSASQDIGTVVADLRPYDLVFPPGTLVVVCLQFPAGGRLVSVGVGPGILADDESPDQDCDRFTLDGGRGDWYTPLPDPVDPNGRPTDWGFAVSFEPASPVEPVSWTAVKRVYRSP